MIIMKCNPGRAHFSLLGLRLYALKCCNRTLARAWFPFSLTHDQGKREADAKLFILLMHSIYIISSSLLKFRTCIVVFIFKVLELGIRLFILDIKFHD